MSRINCSNVIPVYLAEIGAVFSRIQVNPASSWTIRYDTMFGKLQTHSSDPRIKPLISSNNICLLMHLAKLIQCFINIWSLSNRLICRPTMWLEGHHDNLHVRMSCPMNQFSMIKSVVFHANRYLNVCWVALHMGPINFWHHLIFSRRCHYGEIRRTIIWKSDIY